MSDNSKIEWTDATWNPVTGCSLVSPGCTNCYAMKLAGGRLQNHPSRAGLTQESKAGPVWNGQVHFNEGWLRQPLEWKRARRIFVCAHGDLFHESVPDEWIDQVFCIMAIAQNHTFQVLTKRPKRALEYLSKKMRSEDIIDNWYAFTGAPQDLKAWPLRNVWLGVSVEDQARADERIPLLIKTPAAVRFISAEPLLGPVDISIYLASGFLEPPHGDIVNWVIAGGESGPGSRPMHPDWIRALRDQCIAAGVPFFFKQWGEWAPGESAPSAQTRTEEIAIFAGDRWLFDRISPRAGAEMHSDDEPDLWRFGKKAAGRILDGREWDEYPHVQP